MNSPGLRPWLLGYSGEYVLRCPTLNRTICPHRWDLRAVTVLTHFLAKSQIMLILTRRAGEALRIGDDIEVTVMAVNGTQVRIGIKAPRDVAVDREEIAERKRRDRENAASAPAFK